MTASGFASASSRQKTEAGQSTAATQSGGNVLQSTSSPRAAACHVGTSSRCWNTSAMW